MPAQQPRSICILRFSALGDITHMLPIVRTLQNSLPDCHITWIIGKIEFQLLQGLEGIEFIVFDKSKGKKAYLDLHQKLKGKKFDVLLHMQTALRASIASLLINAPIKIGFDKSRTTDFQSLFCNKQISTRPRTHVLDGFFGFLETIGINERILRWAPPIPDSAKQFAAEYIQPKEATLLINACTSARRNNFRNWKAEYYAQVADYAATVCGLKVILTGGSDKNESIMADLICKYSSSKITNLVGKTSIKQLLALISIAEIIISPDTGPAHMGTAVGTPVIGLYVTSNPYRSGPYNDIGSVVNLYPKAVEEEFNLSVNDLPWGKRVRNSEAVNLITVKAVIQQLNKTLTTIKLRKPI